MKKENAATVLKALKTRKVAIQSFRNGLFSNACLNPLFISTKLLLMLFLVSGINESSSRVDLLFTNTAGTMASNIQITPTQMATSLLPASALSNQLGS